MRIAKGIIFITLMLGTLLYFGKIDFIFADEDDLQFSVEGGKIYFFQPQTSRIFTYQTTTGRFSRLLTLEKLGEDLKQSRSSFIIEQDRED